MANEKTAPAGAKPAQGGMIQRIGVASSKALQFVSPEVKDRFGSLIKETAGISLKPNADVIGVATNLAGRGENQAQMVALTAAKAGVPPDMIFHAVGQELSDEASRDLERRMREQFAKTYAPIDAASAKSTELDAVNSAKEAMLREVVSDVADRFGISVNDPARDVKLRKLHVTMKIFLEMSEATMSIVSGGRPANLRMQGA
jgi:hypothetical protein